MVTSTGIGIYRVKIHTNLFSFFLSLSSFLSFSLSDEIVDVVSLDELGDPMSSSSSLAFCFISFPHLLPPKKFFQMFNL